MVKIAIAGGSGGMFLFPTLYRQHAENLADVSAEVAREVIDALLAAKKHEIVLLSRKDVSAQESTPDLAWVRVDYGDVGQLAETLRGVHTVLSFITTHTDPGSAAQKNLIDASIRVGVKRFAPSEWATSKLDYMDVYAGKAVIREYLKAVNKDTKVLEYCLFQPGLFLNYLTHPHRSANHVRTFETQFDFQNRRVIVREGGDDDRITLTTAQDLANVVARAVEYEGGEWPAVGGVKGCEISVAQLVRLGEEIRGGPFSVERLRIDDLRAGTVASSWLPRPSHAAIPPEQASALAGKLLAGLTLNIWAGGLNVSDEWNRLLPDYQFAQPREFLSAAWRGKP